MPSWVQDPVTGKLIPKDQYQRDCHTHFVNSFDDFISPIDGSRIANREQLRNHNRRHGVTNIKEYGDSWFKNKSVERAHELRGDSRAARKDRINSIIESIAKHEGQ